MFDFLFGWRKASKCKRLIRKVQCRLKLLKNKRVTIVRQLKDDLSELLKHGHEQIAFDRVDQLYMDENLVQAYDLLETFCEFLLINLPYIRKNKDCPNDINEAVSSLIFASARFGDLPELLTVRKLFGERYGQRFTNVAVKLLPGNLVNRQIQEKLCINYVPDDVKAKLLVEISRKALKSGPLLLEYSSEQQQQQQHLGYESLVDPILCVEPSNDERGNEVQDPNMAEAEREVVYVDNPSGISKNFLKDLCPSFLSSKAIFPSECSAIVKQASSNSAESLMQKKFETKITAPFPLSDLQMIEQKEPDQDSVLTANEEMSVAVESSSETTETFPEDTICFDDIHEFQSPLRKGGGSNQDQRLFMFRQSVLRTREKLEEEEESPHEKEASRSFGKNKKVSCKRLRRRSISIDITGIQDIECAIYYGDESYDMRRKNHHKKISIKNHQKSSSSSSSSSSSHHPQESSNSPNFVKFSSSFSFGHIKCRLEHHPCYLCTSCDETNDCHCCSPTVSTKIECFCNGKLCTEEKDGGMFLPDNNTMGRKHDYSRAMTMPIERLNENSNSSRDNVYRSNSFPVQEHGGGCSSNRHVHPKLPDYDELAAKFMALKKANLSTVK